LKRPTPGTLFLDEIGELPLATQAKLLRFLDEPVVSRLGGNQSMRLDVRLITATHRDLQELVSKNLFRADLLFRLNVARIRVPRCASTAKISPPWPSTS